MENTKFIKQPEDQKKYGYFDVFGDGFKRILNNKILWIWGIFLSAGGGGSFLSSNDFAEDSPASFQNFLTEFWWLIVLAGVVAFLIGIALWIFSTIVRPGVIRALDRLQNNPKAEMKHRDIWQQGKERFLEVLKLDVLIFLINIGILALSLFIIAIIAFGAFYSYQNSVENLRMLLPFIPLFLLFVFAIIFVFIVMGIIRTIGTVFISLGNLNWATVFKTSYRLIISNKKELVKLLLIIFLISIIGGMTGMIGIGVISGVLISATLFLMKSVEVFATFLFAVAVLIIVALFLFLKSFISLWIQDVVVWWVKKMQGVKAPEEKVSKKVFSEIQPAETVPQGELVLENKNSSNN